MPFTKNYSLFHTVNYKDKMYIFDPFAFGIGGWKIYHSNSGKMGISVDKSLQKELNELMFGNGELPNMLERLKIASEEEKQNFKEISLSWLQLKVRGLKERKEVEGMKTTSVFIPGGMYYYSYDAKYKDILPIWDRFPLTIILEIYSDGFLGLNLHYIEQEKKAAILSYLVERFGNLNENNSILKLAITYKIISSISYKTEFSPCIKRYLFSHVNSKILPVEPHEWAYSIWIPAQDFQFNQGKK